MKTKNTSCWEFLNCPNHIRDECQVFKSDLCNECWLLKDVALICPKQEKQNNCLDCSWYKEKTK